MADQQKEIVKLLEQMAKLAASPNAMAGAVGGTSAPKSEEEAVKKKYAFWETQPVPKLTEEVTTCEPIEPEKKADEIKKEPYHLPEGFEWETLNIDDDEQLKELYKLLNENYVEDDDNMFRFDYSPEFLRWALQPPGWVKEWHAGVRVTKSRKLVGFISAIPATIRVKDKVLNAVEINFLCVIKKLRAKRMAPVLISEITRRVNLNGIFQAVYTAGVVIPKPIGTCRYWHRSLNPKKLIETKFSPLSPRMTLQRTVKLYKLPECQRLPNFRKLDEKDSKKVHAMLEDYLSKFDLAPVFTLEEFEHWFLPRPHVVDSFVVDTPGKGITAFCSYYTLPSTVMHHPTYKHILAAYSYYNVPSEHVSLKDIMQDALITAKNAGYDVYNALDLMENKTFLEDLKFGVGDGNLNYYLFNWKCPHLEPKDISLVLQ